MTGLLVSVRSAAEAEVALAGGADVIDVKEPRRGALGPADPHVWRSIQAVVGDKATTSAALGELLSRPVTELAPETSGFRFAKIGLAGCGREHEWLSRWHEAVGRLPPDVDPVPVAYADWQHADAPHPSETIDLAASSPARLVLIDTHDKSAGGLLDHLPWESLETIARSARRADVRLALAGSLDEAGVKILLELRPAYIGVRGAACAGGRNGTIDLDRVKSLARLLRGARKKLAC